MDTATLLQTNWDLGETEEWEEIADRIPSGERITHTFSATDLAIDVIVADDGISLSLTRAKGRKSAATTEAAAAVEEEPVSCPEGTAPVEVHGNAEKGNGKAAKPLTGNCGRNQGGELEVHYEESRHVDSHTEETLMSIHDQVNMVQTRDDFVQFVRVLARTATENPEWWANRDLSQYIESLGAWVEDMDDYVAGIGEPVFEQPSWRLLARCLIAAAIYE